VIVTDMDAEGFAPSLREREYKTRSFISYPIIINGRKVGLLNLADKEGGGVYDQVDLSLLEIIAPQVALALERSEWQEKATQFQLMSITDPLTGLPNRRYLEERLAEEVNRSKRYDHNLSFLMIDIDDFKVYNDQNGHQAGDLALEMTAHALRIALRSADVAARYGGEEFCILLPQTSLAEARVIAERVREKIEDTNYPHARSQPRGAVTISTGVSTLSKTIETAEQIIWAADRALYEAKDEGKNRICYYQETPLKVLKANGR
jgi:diguanylate cyclase (GGDEF)-like protein